MGLRDENDSLKKLQKWDLYHAYGEFNIKYELLMEHIRDSIIWLIYKNYEIVIDFGNENLDAAADQPMKILLSEMSSFSLIKCFKGLIFETHPNGAHFINKEEKKIIETIFTKINDTNELRNKIIHSTSSLWDVPFLNKKNGITLLSKIDKVGSDGYKSKTATYSIANFDKYIEGIENLSDCIYEIKSLMKSEKVDLKEMKEKLNKINMKSKH